jgi:hypothetical protein
MRLSPRPHWRPPAEEQPERRRPAHGLSCGVNQANRGTLSVISLIDSDHCNELSKRGSGHHRLREQRLQFGVDALEAVSTRPTPRS